MSGRKTNRQRFRDDFREGTGYEWHPWRWFVGAVAIGVAVYLTLLLVGVFTMPFRTDHGVAKRITNPDHVIFTYEKFYDACAGIRSYDQQYESLTKQADELAKETKGLKPADDPLGRRAESLQRVRDDAQGVMQARIAKTNQYNADAQKFTQARFRSANLPHRIAPYPATPDCEGGN